MTFPLADVSDSVIRLVGAAAPLLTAIRVAPNRHITGLLCPGGTIVTVDQALPALEAYTVVLPNRILAPTLAGRRDSSSGLATLQLDADVSVGFPDIGAAALGTVVVVLGADADASPTVRLTLIHRLIRTVEGHFGVLDLSAGHVELGSAVLDSHKRLLGMTALGPNGEAIVIPGACIGRMLHRREKGAVTATAPQPAPAESTSPYTRRGWLGVALQPIIVPDQLIARVGQAKGRLVVNITTGGPADRAGLRVGDVLLSLNGTSVGGELGLRNYLADEPIGSKIEVRLLRDGRLVSAYLVVAAQP
jgi:S1-C subfamily serine protease